MRLVIMMDLDNADFDDSLEVALSERLFRLAERVVTEDLKPGWTHVIRDENGNRIGVADVFGPERPTQKGGAA